MDRIEMLNEINAMIEASNVDRTFEAMASLELEIGIERNAGFFALAGPVMAKVAELEEETAELEVVFADEKPVIDYSGIDGVVLEKVLKGVRKATLGQTQLYFSSILLEKPDDVKGWKEVGDKFFPGISISNTIKYMVLKFAKAGALEWDGNYKSRINWL